MGKKTFKDKFQRFETKYVISKEVLANLLMEFEEHMVEDDHAYSTISNLYYDTPTFNRRQPGFLGNQKESTENRL